MDNTNIPHSSGLSSTVSIAAISNALPPPSPLQALWGCICFPAPSPDLSPFSLQPWARSSPYYQPTSQPVNDLVLWLSECHPSLCREHFGTQESCIHGTYGCGHYIQWCISGLFSGESWGCHDNCVSVELLCAWPQHPHTSAANAFILLVSCAVGRVMGNAKMLRCSMQLSSTVQRGAQLRASSVTSFPKENDFFLECGLGEGGLVCSKSLCTFSHPPGLGWQEEHWAQDQGSQQKYCKPEPICRHPRLPVRIPD